MRVVTAQADRPKVEMLTGCGLALTAQWWVLLAERAEPDAEPEQIAVQARAWAR